MGHLSKTRDVSARGFPIYGQVWSTYPRPSHGYVIQSSAVGERRAWLFIEGECVDHCGDHMSPSLYLSPEDARELAHALLDFANEAEAACPV